MNLLPFFDAELQVQLHFLAGVLAVGLGPVALYRRKRDRLHKLAGRIWVLVMVFLAISGLFIHQVQLIGPFSPIHLLSILVLVSLWRGVAAIRARNIQAHQSVMRALYWQALGIGGLFTFLPGRTLNEMLFAGWPEAGWGVIGCGLTAIAIAARRTRAPQSPHPV